ncbi:MAG: hypothetical protein V4671_23365 [Armatimonadota bacterium]
MRRRRNADAPSSNDVTTDITDVSVPDEATEVNTSDNGSEFIESAPLTPETTEPASASSPGENSGEAEKKPRRRAPRRKSVDTPAEETPVDTEPTPATPTADIPLMDAPPAEKPKRAPRRRAAKAEAVPVSETVVEEVPVEETPAPVAEITETEVPAAEPEALAEAPAETEPEAEDPNVSGEAAPDQEASAETEISAAELPPSEKRSRRRRSSRRGGNGAGTAETSDTVMPAAETEVREAVASTGDADEVEASAPTKAPGSGRSSRRNRSGRQNQNSPAETPPAAPDDSGAPKRIRGLRRTPAAPTEFLPAPTLAAEIVPVPSEEAEGAAEAPKRIRGLRTRRVITAVASLVTPTLAAETPPQDLLPPPYQPLPDEVLARLPETKIVVNKGIADLVINGAPQLPLWFFVNTEAAEDPETGRETAIRQIRLAYESGIRFFTLLSHLPWKMRSGERRYDILDSMLQMVAENAPEAMILPRLIFSPPLSWERTHPDEMALYTDGEPGDVSFASREFWEGEADETVRAAVEHVAEGPHAGRVFGFYLEHAEWLYEKGRGYDISPANEAGFRSWLRQRYKNNEVVLRAAWHDGGVTFDAAEIPSYPPPAGSTLFFGPRETRWSDFHEYSSDIVAQVITRLGKAVKEASGGRSAVAVSYGYTLEINRAASGHFALAQVLQSPNIDILTGPISYSGRTPGGAATFPAPIDSVTLAGKLWISEDDSKTHRASDETPDTYNPKIANLEGTRAVQARNFGAALARGTGISWMDLWGEGWLDDQEIWQGIAYLRNLAEGVAARRHAPDSPGLPEPDVAVIVDERSFFGVRSDEFLLGHLVAQQRDALLRSGANIGFYLLSDLAKPEFPAAPKLLLFLNAYRIPGNVRAAIRERFQDDGRTLAWLYAPGTRETADGVVTELSEVIGMQLRLQPWGSKAGTQALSGARSPLSDALRGQKIGEETRFNPTYYAADPKATALGEYVATGNPSLALRKHARWQSVFIGEVASLTVPLLRGLYRLSGVPTLTVDDDAAWIGDNLLCLHSAPGGGTTVYLPEESVLFDLLTGETLASDGFGARLSMPPRGTRLLFFGDASEVARFGGDPNDGPPGLTREELPVLPAPFVFEAGPTAPAPAKVRSAPAAGVPVDPEDEALFTAALGEEFVPTEAEIGDGGVAVAAETESEAAARKKRRRRRRGRGKRGDLAEGAEIEPGAEGEAGLLGDEDEDIDEDESDPEIALDVESESIEYTEMTPGVMIFDVATETFAASVPPGPAPRVRPSLEELLPQSDLPDGGELPPIPDELLPLPDGGLGLTGISETDAEGDADASPEAARRARRSRGGVGRYRRGRQNTDAAATSDEAPTTEAISETSSGEAIEEASLQSVLTDDTLDND